MNRFLQRVFPFLRPKPIIQKDPALSRAEQLARRWAQLTEELRILDMEGRYAGFNIKFAERRKIEEELNMVNMKEINNGEVDS